MAHREYHVEQPRAAHTHTVIFLHGRDSDGREFADEFFESEASGPVEQPRKLRDLLPGIRWVFPSAPILRSERFGIEMSQWFDIWSAKWRRLLGILWYDGHTTQVVESLEPDTADSTLLHIAD